MFSCAFVDGDVYSFYDAEYNAHVVKQYKKGWGLIVGGEYGNNEAGAVVHIYFETFQEMLMWVSDEYGLWSGEQ